MKLNLKNLKNLKKGFKELTPSQLATGRISGQIGMLIGLVVVFFEMIIMHNWGWTIFIFAFAIFQAFQLKGELQAYRNLKLMEKQMKAMQSVDFNEQLDRLEREANKNDE